MKTWAIVVFLLVVAFSAFALLNWSAIATPTQLSVGFTTVHAPLGLILLIGSGLLAAAFLVLSAYQQTAGLFEARRFARDLRAARELADKAEASRFTDLRAYLEGELQALNKATGTQADVDARLVELREVLTNKLVEVENGLSAHVAEVEDKLDRVLNASAQ